MKPAKIQWFERTDEFILDRETLAAIMDFLDGISLRHSQDLPLGWKEFDSKIRMPINKLMTSYDIKKRK
jgi:hypothetical protein